MKKLKAFILILILFPATAFAEKQVPDSAGQLILSYAPLVKKTAPAVVNIYTRKKVKVLSPFLYDPFFKQFFGDEFEGLENGGLMKEKIENSLGSGIIVRPDGLIITNNHVIKGSDEIIVVLNDRREFEAKIVLTDPKTDMALLKINTDEKLQSIEIGDSDAMEVGDVVLAIGNPFGVGQTVTQGIVSALARTTIGITDFQFFIQTDAPINPGNSGGPLIDMNGKMVGMNSAIYSRSGGSNGIGFAIPAAMVKTILKSYETGGKVVRPWIGVSVQEVNAEIAKSLNMEKPEGAIVKHVYKGGPAEKAGIRVGDIILSVDDKEINDDRSLKFRVATYSIGTKAEFVILRNGKKLTTNVMMEKPSDAELAEPTKIRGANPFAGATIANITPTIADELDISDEIAGVVITDVEKPSSANNLGFMKGDIIEKINGKSIKTVTEAKSILATRPPVGWTVSIRRGSEILTVTIRG